MSPEPLQLDEFRRRISLRARQSPGQWDASKRLIQQEAFPETISRLLQRVRDTSLPPAIKDPLLHVLQPQQAKRVQDLDGEWLKTLTGFPPAKAIRALCIFYELIVPPRSQWPIQTMSSKEIEDYIQRSTNPFDLLRDTDVASVLDLGAGDLSFADELVEHYVSELQQRHRNLILHCLDRLDPRSQLGGPLHPQQDRLRALRDRAGLTFSFFGDQDMFALDQLDDTGKLAPRYTIVTCWAPATPTFAYEPSRLSRSVMTEDLSRTKGSFRSSRFRGEPALEVQHGERRLLFPPWKFDIIGPRALLNLMAARGALCVLGAVDNQVFWELLAQVLDDSRYRPQDRLFTAANLPEIFGEVYDSLNRLSIGDSVDLADLGILRRFSLSPESVDTQAHQAPTFRSVRIRRGATFPGIPAGSTARKFSGMVEEVAPWFLTLVPS
ncbi:MAG: hypothetical protein HP493_11340 [Nitrospira sp.]|nr:hypothetical protein [Nitrospira sp.]